MRRRRDYTKEAFPKTARERVPSSVDHGLGHIDMVAFYAMSEGNSSGRENANLYMRGMREGCDGEPLDDMQVLEILEVSGIEGLRSYIVGHMEGLSEAAEDEEE